MKTKYLLLALLVSTSSALALSEQEIAEHKETVSSFDTSRVKAANAILALAGERLETENWAEAATLYGRIRREFSDHGELTTTAANKLRLLSLQLRARLEQKQQQAQSAQRHYENLQAHLEILEQRPPAEKLPFPASDDPRYREMHQEYSSVVLAGDNKAAEALRLKMGQWIEKIYLPEMQQAVPAWDQICRNRHKEVESLSLMLASAVFR